jgi:hypothetical protein
MQPHPTMPLASECRKTLRGIMKSLKRDIDAHRARGMPTDEQRVDELIKVFLAYEEAENILMRAGL